MRRIWPTVAAAICLAVLAAFLRWGPEAKADKEPGDAEGVKVITLARDQVKRIAIERPGSTVTLRWSDGTEAWFLDPGVTRADESKVSSLLSACCPLEAKRTVSGAPSAFGLDQPTVTLRLNDGEQVLTVGAKNEAAGGYYARREGDEQIYLIDSYAVDALLQESWVMP